MLKPTLLLLLLLMTVSGSAVTASNTARCDLGLDTVVYLQEIVVYPEKQKYNSITPKTTRQSISISNNKSYNFFVSRVPLIKEKTYRIRGVQFYFSVRGKSKGFYVLPLVYSSKNNTPHEDLLKDSPVFFVDKNVKNRVYFDLSAYNLIFSGFSEFFVGIDFPGRSENSDETNLYIKGGIATKEGVSYIKKRCYECPQTSFLRLEMPQSNKDVTLKYKLYYTEVKEEE
ncbi:MAG: hypothetical protein ACK5KP_12935 [Paludibacteraceae bacterium]